MYRNWCIILWSGCINGVPINWQPILYILNEGTYQCARAESNLIWFESFEKRPNKSSYKSNEQHQQLNSSYMNKQIWHKQITRMWFPNKRDMAEGFWFLYMVFCSTFTRNTKYRSRLWILETQNTRWMEIKAVCISLYMWIIRIFSTYRSVCNKNQSTSEKFCFL